MLSSFLFNCRDEPCTDVPDGVQGFVASVIQNALYHVYEHDFSSKTPRETTTGTTENLLQSKTEPDDAFDLSTYQPNNFEVFEKDSSAASLKESGKQRVILDDEPHPTPNIVWPTIGEFNKELGLKKIEEYIKTQQIGVYYQVETFRTMHRPGITRFCEQWLRDVIDSKARLMPYINF
ncbi:uncharacterized protein DEA37_0007517 [Paragonimus westermani]|uniref:Uncharacterized protein n=1 Tax=Paragonimus westermani TaxID=34504 RepID=A0A5J4NUP9_9TREM|nr:uncharacterized protein DEA37_0007517 [Paragonimus westermani]